MNTLKRFIAIATVLSTTLTCTAADTEKEPRTENEIDIAGMYSGSFRLRHRRGNIWGIRIFIDPIIQGDRVSGKVTIYGGSCPGEDRFFIGTFRNGNLIAEPVKTGFCSSPRLNVKVSNSSLSGTLVGNGEEYDLTAGK